MRILIYGAGVIGSLYAVKLTQAVYDVSIFARGRRLSELQKKGLLYRQKENFFSVEVTIMDELKDDDSYDYVFLTVRADQLHTALKSLKTNY